jgi:predicted nucleic acid-binding protein
MINKGKSSTIDLLVDTDVWSYIFKNDTRSAPYLTQMRGRRLGVSVQTVAELYKWAFYHKWAQSRVDKMVLSLQQFVLIRHDAECALLWGRVCAERERAGLPISPQDAWIAASALRHRVPLLTNNAPDFQEISTLIVLSA